MHIYDIQAIGLSGATPKGGWSEELRPEYTVHTLVIVRTDEVITGTGSVFTNAGLVRAARHTDGAAISARQVRMSMALIAGSYPSAVLP